MTEEQSNPVPEEEEKEVQEVSGNDGEFWGRLLHQRAKQEIAREQDSLGKGKR